MSWRAVGFIPTVPASFVNAAPYNGFRISVRQRAVPSNENLAVRPVSPRYHRDEPGGSLTRAMHCPLDLLIVESELQIREPAIHEMVSGGSATTRDRVPRAGVRGPVAAT